MPKTNDTHASSVAARGAQVRCMDPIPDDVTPVMLNALHLCKHEMLAAVHRVYFIVPPKIADELIKKQLDQIFPPKNP